MPESAKDFIEKLLVIDPEKRLGAKDYKELKSHVFFKGINFETLSSMKPPTLKNLLENLFLLKISLQRKRRKEKRFLKRKEKNGKNS